MNVRFAYALDPFDDVYINFATDKYQPFVTEVPDGDSIYDGSTGNYYLTNHVNLDIDGILKISIEDLTRLFYYVAPAVLVLNSVNSAIAIEPVIHLGAGVTFSITI